MVLVFQGRVAALTKSGNIQALFGEGDSSGQTIVVHKPNKGFDLIRDSKMPNPVEGDVD